MDNKQEKELGTKNKINILKERLTEIYATELLEYYENKKYDKTNLERLQQAMELVSEIDEDVKIYRAINSVENDSSEKDFEIKTEDECSNNNNEECFYEQEENESDYEKFKKEIEKIINMQSMENGSNIPDFILAQYLTDCLKTFDKTINRREKWYGRENNNTII